MLKKVLLNSLIFALASTAFAQTTDRCGTVQLIEYRNQLYPGYAESVKQVFENAKANKPQNSEKIDPIYTIPVVVHVVYNTPEQNIADSVVENQIEILNDDYNRWNADTVNMRPVFEPVKGSPQIEFKLATIDEAGATTTGITRTNTATTTFGSWDIFFGDFTETEKVKSTADGGMDPWDQARYLNIWVCNMEISETPALLGYATPPDGLSNWPAGTVDGLEDGVVIQYQAFGGNNPNELDMGGGPEEVLGRTAVHEVGHYLGLRHIWGDGGCAEQDGIDDTPNADAQSDFDCDDTKNTCVDDINGEDLPDMIENYMDYSSESCQNSFTQGQADLMHAVLENERYDLVHGNEASIDEKGQEVVAMYPNPTKDNVTLQFAEENKVEVIVADLNGKVMLQQTSEGKSIVLDLSTISSGVYFVKSILEHGSTSVHRVVKK